ncbi:MAG: DUF4301 family protein [Tunicatimonas sp.]
MFSDPDLTFLRQRGTNPDTAEQQLQYFREGFPPLQLVKAATVDDGILRIDDALADEFVKKYDAESPVRRVVKFVPASGAASRMFKSLFAFAKSYDSSESAYQHLTQDPEQRPIFDFFKRIQDFAFYNDLSHTQSQREVGLNESVLQRRYPDVLNTLLEEDGLNYGNLPKGLLKFHRYENMSRTPVEEHLVEGAHYCRDAKDNVYLHFTVSPEHRALFEQHVHEAKERYEQQFGVTYHVSFSEQKPATDTIAVDPNNEPFRNADGTLLFRPGGHGALIENLNDLDADLVFIKNIDNVVPDRLKEETYQYKKLLGGILLALQEKIFSYRRQLDNLEEAHAESLEEVRAFVEEQLGAVPAQVFASMDGAEKAAFLIEKLDRPIRVCGMVKNEGEPGGGPFWVMSPDGSTSLQIVESAQVDMSDPEQQSAWENATHFNPVDIVCSLRDHEGSKFDLTHYVNEQAGFIAQKSKDGKELKALELPGLWNGAMADWNTVFVEVPIGTFNPVKTVNDLLRTQHQKG